MKSAKEIIRALLTSYIYNRDDGYMIEVLYEVKKRLEKDSSVNYTDDGNIIYGTLVCLYGDYGTSPRSGWFYAVDNRIVKEIIEEIDEYLKDHVVIFSSKEAEEPEHENQ